MDFEGAAEVGMRIDAGELHLGAAGCATRAQRRSWQAAIGDHVATSIELRTQLHINGTLARWFPAPIA